MKLEYTTGCIADTTNINDKEIMDSSLEEVKDVLIKLVSREKDLSTLQYCFMNLMESQGEYSCSSHPCSSCGDYISTYLLDI